MYKNALKEDLIRVVQELDGTETATHIGIREAEDWFRPIDLAKECDIYISSRSGSRKEIPITYGNTAADSVRSEWPLWHAAKSKTVFARRRS
ncbi:hypothetical protein TNCV_222241 [Trichonephila clavipes]|nr:hypothetical protein TNCV_222241 [Trichonephila clavipes]